MFALFEWKEGCEKQKKFFRTQSPSTSNFLRLPRCGCREFGIERTAGNMAGLSSKAEAPACAGVVLLRTSYPAACLSLGL